MRFRIVLLSCVISVVALGASADTWQFKPILRKRPFVYGATRIVVTTDARENQRFPKFRLEVFNAGKRVALLPGVAVEQVFASPDNSLFLGLSNTGLPGTAAIVFTAEGEIRLLATHRIASFDYCNQSITLFREWYDSANPGVRFVLDGPRSDQGIFLRSCQGKEIELMRTFQQAVARAGAAN